MKQLELNCTLDSLSADKSVKFLCCYCYNVWARRAGCSFTRSKTLEATTPNIQQIHLSLIDQQEIYNGFKCDYKHLYSFEVDTKIVAKCFAARLEKVLPLKAVDWTWQACFLDHPNSQTLLSGSVQWTRLASFYNIFNKNLITISDRSFVFFNRKWN